MVGYLDNKKQTSKRTPNQTKILIFFPFSNWFIYLMLKLILEKIPGIFYVKKLNHNHDFWICLLDYSVQVSIFFHPLVQSSMGVIQMI